MEKTHKKYNFSAIKNQYLIETRGIGFKEIIAAINDEKILNIIEHLNKQKYAQQKMYIIEVRDYVYLVPFVVESEESVFLKTIIPSRKAKKQYLKER